MLKNKKEGNLFWSIDGKMWKIIFQILHELKGYQIHGQWQCQKGQKD